MKMNGRLCVKSLLSALVSALATSFAAAQEEPFLKVDINAGSSGVNAQEGWSGFPYTVGNQSTVREETYDVISPFVPDGTVKVEINCGTSIEDETTTSTARDRKNDDAPASFPAAFPLSNVYRDCITCSKPIWLRLSGLKTEVPYVLTVYCYDHNSTKTNNIVRVIDGEDCGLVAKVPFSAGTAFSAETDPELYAASLTAYPEEDGTLMIRVWDEHSKGGAFAGFTLAKGEPVLDFALDFNNNSVQDGQFRAVQDGFHAFWFSGENQEMKTRSYSGLPFSGAAEGALSVSVYMVDPPADKKFIFRDRDSNGMNIYREVVPFYNAMRDVMLAQDTPLYIAFSGLLPNARFTLTYCPYDWNAKSQTCTVTDWTTGSAGASKSVTTEQHYAFTDETPADHFAVTLNVRADETGRIVIKNAGSPGSSSVSWLRLTYLPPPIGMTVIIR